eukprot:6199147-Pleurochrysis_carterae.AAC.2
MVRMLHGCTCSAHPIACNWVSLNGCSCDSNGLAATGVRSARAQGTSLLFDCCSRVNLHWHIAYRSLSCKRSEMAGPAGTRNEVAVSIGCHHILTFAFPACHPP